jgi:hypothetical protein
MTSAQELKEKHKVEVLERIAEALERLVTLAEEAADEADQS